MNEWQNFRNFFFSFLHFQTKELKEHTFKKDFYISVPININLMQVFYYKELFRFLANNLEEIFHHLKQSNYSLLRRYYP
jgi:hypothetical protein